MISYRFQFPSVIGCLLVLIGVVGCGEARRTGDAGTPGTNAAPQEFAVRGVVREVKADGRTVIIRHEAIPGYMEAMTMPFKVRESNELASVRAGAEVTFRLNVTEDASWIDQVRPTGKSVAVEAKAASPATNAAAAAGEFGLANIPQFSLTNQFGRPFSFAQLQGRAVAMTFFFTRCPVPEYCPRLAKNFQGALAKLKARADGPTNYHFVSVSFDPAVDSPLVLRAYGQGYGYDSNHWTFVTGNAAHITELAAGFGVQAKPDGGSFDHNFSTVVFDATGKMQNLWPIGGDMTEQLVTELVKGAAAR
jgi:protein SCO1